MEGDDATPAGVPVALTRPLGFHRRCMDGTDQPRPRCVALAGEVKRAVRCTIHDRRPSVCRAFTASFEHGEREERCESVRALHGLPPLRPEDWLPAQDDDEPPHLSRPPRRAA